MGRDLRELGQRELVAFRQTTARNTAYSSWRTLPGQFVALHQRHRFGPDGADGAVLLFAAKRARKRLARSGISSRRVRSGGMAIGTRSAGNRGPRGSGPASPSSIRFWLVAEITRISTFTGLRPPTGSTSPSCRARSSFTCASSGSSPTSSRNSVPPEASTNLPTWRSCAPVNEPFRGRTGCFR